MTCCTLNVKITIAAIGISAGIMAGLYFASMDHNISTTVMALTSSIFASLALHLHLSHKKGRMEEWTESRFNKIFYVCSVLFVFSSVAMVGCLIYAGINKQTLTHEGLKGENLWMTAVWSFMTAKWTGASAWFTRKYSAAVIRPLAHTPPLY